MFFGSALSANFRVQPLLNYLVENAPHPQPRAAIERTVDPGEEKFSAFILEIQANMDPAHRGKWCIYRICSIKFERGMSFPHADQKQMRLGRPTNFMAQDESSR